MCYFLYGAVNDGINADDYKKTIKNTGFHFSFGNITSVNECVASCGNNYRITHNHCDCDTAIGQKHTNKKELEELKDLLLNLQSVRGIKHVLISKNWWEETNNKQETVHIQDIDVLHFLANIEDNCLYKIELYKKYY
ncbi:MAG: hypothetical protein E7523_11030 [Ruminococcaceae bacterium]|nr:hypothetical protein [Oscillospiraceae bacterium]